jgi:hypothetical protein
VSAWAVSYLDDGDAVLIVDERRPMRSPRPARLSEAPLALSAMSNTGFSGCFARCG